MKAILSVFFLISVSTLSLAADFEGETQFTHYDLEGDYHVTCTGGGQIEFKTHFCRGYLLSPFSWAYFSADVQGQKTEVELSRVKPDGKVVRKKMKWDKTNNRTQKRVNLWVRTLFQTPLLAMGLNTINYHFFGTSNTQESGSVEVEVFNGGVRVCNDLNETTTNNDFCGNSSQACSHFFRVQKNCQ